MTEAGGRRPLISSLDLVVDWRILLAPNPIGNCVRFSPVTTRVNIISFVATCRKVAGGLVLAAVSMGANPAMAESAASGEIAARTPVAQPGAHAAPGNADESFSSQFRAWNMHDAAAAPVPARISVGSMPAMTNIAIHANPGLEHVTFGRALDAAGMPIDFSRIRTSTPGYSRRNFAGSMDAVAMPSRLPISGSALTSGFGMRQHPLLGGRRAHSGIDLAAPTGTPIYATADGMVGKAQWQGGYGLFVEMEHGGGLQTRFGHMSRLNVAAGQQMRKGDLIGYVGSTGLSTGPHLHYEIRVNGQAVNPASRSTR